MTTRLGLAGVGYQYPRSTGWALRGVDLDVRAGEIVCVVGPSGSGKTTLLRLVSGLLTPDTGSVTLDGVDVTSTAPERRAVAMVFQGFALFPHLSVKDNIGFGLRVRRDAARAERVALVADRLGLTGLLGRRPGQLSGGERQRVALGRALVRDPAVFCLDEPLASLDQALRADARRLLAEVLRAEDRGALFVTHDQVEAMTLGDRIAVIRDGRLEQLGTPREIYTAPATAFVASFLGSPPATVVEGGTAAALGLTGAASFALRPEDVQLSTAGGATGVVRETADVGALVHVGVEVEGTVVVASVAPAEAPRVGDIVHVSVDPQRALRFDAAGARTST